MPLPSSDAAARSFRASLLLLRGPLPVPTDGEPGTCRICHAAAPVASDLCHGCASVHPELRCEVLPMALSLHGGLLHTQLWGYKNIRDEVLRVSMTRRIASLVSAFVAGHGTCIGDFDYLTCVPSERRVAPASIVSLVPPLADRYRQVLGASPGAACSSSSDGRTRGARTVDPGRFTVEDSVRGARILLFDDTFTSGASAFAAAAALRQAGAAEVRALVIGRHVRPDRPDSRALVERLVGRSWTLLGCARCAA